MTELDKIAGNHPARRKEIVEAARAIAAEEGWPAVTVRAVAGRIGCSAPAIYQYFRDKDAVLAALAEQAELDLSAALEAAVSEVRGPAKRLRALVRGLWQFALANRELYAVMFGLDGLRPHLASPSASLAILRQAAGEFAARRETPADAGNLADRIAGVAHGFISLSLAGALAGGPDRALVLLMEVLEAIIKEQGRH